METDQWGYLAVIRKALWNHVSLLGSYVEQVVAKFYACLPGSKDEADKEEIAVKVRNHLYKFSPAMINDALELGPLTEEEDNDDTILNAIPVTELVEFLTDGTRKEWDNLTTADLTPSYGVLMIVAAYNWIPSTHKTHVSLDRARLIYKMAHGIRVDMGKMILKQIVNLSVIQHRNSRWLIFPRLIMKLLQKQHHVPSRPGDKVERTIV